MLIEREQELLVLEKVLYDAQAGHGGLVAVGGPPGIGKSRVLEAARERGLEAGMQVLHARGHALEREFGLGLARQLFDRTLARAAAPVREDLLAGPAALAAPLLDRGTPESPPVGDQHGMSVAHGLYWLTVNLAEQAPLLVAVDDLQWADALSLQFLAYLSNRLADLPVALVLAARPGERVPLLDGLMGDRQATALRPAALSPAGVGALVRARLPDAAEELLGACARVSGGNPFLVQELVRTMVAEEWRLNAEDAHRLDDVAAETIARAALIRLRLLPAAAVSLAEALAVLGDEAPLRRAAALSGLHPSVAVPAADILAGAEVLGSVQPLAFVHSVVRESVYEQIPAAKRADAHLRAARVLAEEPLAPEIVAAQLVHARAGGERWVVDTLSAAAVAASARGDQQAAVRYLHRALEEPPAPDAQGRVLLALGRAEAPLGDMNALTHLDRALERTADPRERAEILLATGRSLVPSGRMDEAARAFQRGSDELAVTGGHASDEKLVLELRASRALAAIYGTVETAAALAEITGIAADARAPRTPGERSLIGVLAGVHILRGDQREDAVALARRAWDDGALLRDETADSLNTYTPSFVLASAGELEEARCMCDAALAEARERGSPMGYANACYWRLQVQQRLGRLGDAVADGVAALDAVTYGWTLAAAGAAGLLAMCLLDRDELERAAAMLAQHPPAEGQGADATHGYYYEATAHVALAQAAPRRALASLAECERLTAAAGCVNPAPLDWRSPAALAHVQLSEHARARELADENLSLARAFGEPRALGIALRTAGLVAAGEERGALLAEAVATLRTSAAVLELARTLLELGAHTRRGGEPRAAREPLREARELAQQCHAGALRRRTDEELAASGARPRRTALRGPDSLTPSELRVAELAAEGLTTRQIAQSLFVTPKTVEKHLSNAYDKLAIRSRDALAEALQPAPVA
ncbi:MAG TPA: AAA family ATPase [Solirubrobacteraceae bacterium]|nr:AAA family ATPase [Solirubrobacteraceae bacterium]